MKITRSMNREDLRSHVIYRQTVAYFNVVVTARYQILESRHTALQNFDNRACTANRASFQEVWSMAISQKFEEDVQYFADFMRTLKSSAKHKQQI